MILSAHLKEHLNGPQAFWIGTRDADLIPEAVRGAVVIVKPLNVLRILVQKEQAQKTLENLRHNRRVALSSIDPSNLESYQFKGTFIKSEDATAEELDLIKERKVVFNEVLLTWGLPDGLVYKLPTFPTIALEFEIEEIFEQTPKQGTGQLMSELSGR